MSSRWRIAQAALRWPDLRLRTWLAALLVAVSLLPLSAFLDIRQSQAQLLDSTKSLLRSGAQQIARALDEFHRGRLQTVERIARFPETTAFCLADAASVLFGFGRPSLTRLAASLRARLRAGWRRTATLWALPVRSPMQRSGLRLHRDAEHRGQAGIAGRGDDSGPFPCPGIAGVVSFTLRVNDARLTN